MKTVKKQGLTTQQKKYLRYQVLQYYLFVVLVKSRPVKKPPRRRSTKKLPNTTPIISMGDISRSADNITKNKKPKSKWSTLFRSKYVKISAAVFAVLFAVVLVQLLYPSGRSLPLSRLETAGYLGFADKQAILSSFEDFDSRIVTVHTHSKNITTSYKDLGVSIEPFKTVEVMTEYSFKDRLIPFSILIKGNKNFPISRNLNDAQLALFVESVVAQASKQPKDAQIKLKGTKFIVENSEEGYEYQVAALKSRILRADLADKGQIIFTPTILEPNITTDHAQYVASRMQQRIDNPLIINAESKSRRVESAIMASWVDIVHQPKEKKVEVIFNKKRVDQSLRSFASEVDRDPIPTVVTYLNGLQAGRIQGKVGKSLQYIDLITRIVDNVSPLTSTLEASVVTIPPPEVIDRKYTKDSQGLQKLLDYWTSVNQGQYSIDLRTINGHIKANLNSHRLMPSVGVYRTYIASLVYGKLTAGSISPYSLTQTGQTVDVCIDRMVRESDVPCTDALGSLVGWGVSDQLLRAQGFDSTTLTQGAGLTTANDTSDWLTKLLGWEITSIDQAQSLNDIMTRQIYRDGIPAGSQGFSVANKFGSYGHITNDIGIVYHPNGTYVLSILSEGSNPSLIASLATEINKVMNQ